MRFGPEQADLLRDLLVWRRDVRHFRPDPLPDGAEGRLRAAMDLAPSVGNARPWRVLRVESAAKRRLIRDNFAAENARAAAGYQGDQARDYAALKLAGLDHAPLQLAVFTQQDPSAGHGLGRATMPETLEQSTSMAIFALWLTARAENLGVGMVSILDPRRVEADLDAPDDWRLTAYLCIGIPEWDDDTPLLHRAGWQANSTTRWQRV
ncbi:5,6-dimethylbenzimidazole synthase [Paracoccus jiaweipingae]|uniref:5,6-dimethylbenzimidazole synthase n=1 Tax=unclassified Paracoccus (in: a-proteobacteria) TaxID=2688777 RepID=UPI0037968BF1